MNERIVEIAGVDEFWQEIVYKEIREKIVRCRDCACFDDANEFGQWCTQLDFGKKEIANGFCAWGIRKDDA